MLDKTGTLTQGAFRLSEIAPAEGVTEEALLETAALVEQFSSHPIALSLLRAWGKTPDPSRVSEVENVAGEGIRARLDGVPVAVGNVALMARVGVETTEQPHTLAGSVVFVARDGVLMGHLTVKDEIKPDAKTALAELRRAGVKRIVMLTGDRTAVAAEVAAALGPDDKVNRLAALIEEGRARSPRGKLAFVGDGINDAPVLSRADVGIAMGALGSDAAIEAADVVLMDDRLAGIAAAMSISRRTSRIVRQNIAFALGVKGLVLLLGALGLAGMWAAVFADVGVAVIAILNAMRTLR